MLMSRLAILEEALGRELIAKKKKKKKFSKEQKKNNFPPNTSLQDRVKNVSSGPTATPRKGGKF